MRFRPIWRVNRVRWAGVGGSCIISVRIPGNQRVVSHNNQRPALITASVNWLNGVRWISLSHNYTPIYHPLFFDLSFFPLFFNLRPHFTILYTVIIYIITIFLPHTTKSIKKKTSTFVPNPKPIYRMKMCGRNIYITLFLCNFSAESWRDQNRVPTTCNNIYAVIVLHKKEPFLSDSHIYLDTKFIRKVQMTPSNLGPKTHSIPKWYNHI